MGGDLRAGWGAKHFVTLRAMLCWTENVYSRASDTPAKIMLECRVFARLVGRDISRSKFADPQFTSRSTRNKTYR
jgi:hypothetical protein